ncbi:hypothetical protein HGO38_12835 [Rhizobium sp. CG5]|uniref:sensor histidine kinase n=1 Tax=Rhizobium sp. CG5 TaxID=2726076 RepID=UPI0020337A88|nr:sensor histidine kinase [Rhizobium sp. CG5]MCM2474361.1 hypothetical protein [Rhizobium sp. CG5]
MTRVKLSRRLFIITAVALAPAAIILFYNVFTGRQARERELHGEALRLGQLASLEMQRVVSGLENVLVAVAAVPAVQRFDTDACNAYVERVSEGLPQFSGLSVVDRQGTIRCRQLSEGLGTSLSARRDIQEAMVRGVFVLGEYALDPITKKPSLTMAMPIRDEAGNITGAVAGALGLEWLDQMLLQRSFVRNSALTIADRHGVILARHPFPERFVGTTIPKAYLHLVDADYPGTLEVMSQDGVQRVIGYYPATQSGIYVSVGTSTETAYATINRTTRFGLAIAALGILSAFLLAWLTSRQLVRRPVNRLVRTIEAWRASDEGARTGMTARDGELGMVGFAIDEFMDELLKTRAERRRHEQQRELLAGELDHRVKNLLSTIQAIARQTFRQVDGSSEALAVFSQRLSAIAEAHNLLMKDGWQSAPLASVVARAIAPFDSDPSRFAIEGEPLDIHARAALALAMALHELCTNAAKYGALTSAQGRVTIHWQVEALDEPSFRFSWVESDGPVVTPPTRTGFGSTMIEKVLAQELQAKVDMAYPPQGVACVIVTPLSKVVSCDPQTAADESNVLPP